ncbi:MAG: PQQ-binding-like beta-propeller repeat protein [Candidatus Bathyarchaeota archaeon]|nr:PQQ-binding-like beta-propeller repeat protein [Candidatus Bathyarchaeota archaeon]
MKPKLSKSLFSVALILLLTTSAFMLLAPTADAHDPPWEIPTYAYITVSPDPVGIHQTAFVIMWLDKVPPTSTGIGGDRWEDLTVVVTKPDGTTMTIGPMNSDSVASAFSLFTPDQLGVYTFDFSMPDQILDLENPENGVAGNPSDYVNDTYLGSSASTTLTVQAEDVPEAPTYPLPTEYWTRPIEAQNTAWDLLASNWPGGALFPDRFQSSGAAPDSAHVLWTKPLSDGGLVGGEFSIPAATYYTGLSYEGRFGNPMIMNGRLYYDTPLSDSPSGGPFVCVDLATGETLWENDAISPTFGTLYLYESPNQHGVIGDGYLIQASGGGGFFASAAPSNWTVYDSRTGEWLFTMTDVPGGFSTAFSILGGYGSGAVGSNGELLNFQFDNTNNWLAMWSSAAEPTTGLVSRPGNTTDAYQYRPVGKVVNMSDAYIWNVTIPDLPAGSSILRAIPNDMVLFATPTASFISFGTPATVTVTAISTKAENRGEMLWQESYDAPDGNITRTFGPVDPETRVFTMTDKETMQWLGFDMDTGAKLWGPVGDFRAFQYYGQVSNPPAPGQIAYGNLYVGGYGGEIHCFDLRSGDVNWVYNNTFSGDQTPWGLYPLFVATIADGKVYAFTSEHSPNVPPYKGAQVRCINATDGSEIWTMDGWYAIGSFGEEPAPIADGYLVYLNVYDMQIYCVGKGPSETTVAVPMTSVAVDECFTITGTVLDQSPGAEGYAAMSDASMSSWMEYVYMQKPMPQDAIGVTVKLTAFDPNCNEIIIGETTVDTKGNFGFTWSPEVPGTYQIVATFEGSDSYYSSYATTYLTSVEAPSASVSPTPTDTSMPTSTPSASASPSPSVAPPGTDDATGTYILLAAAVVVIVAVAGVAALFLRRRQ